VNVQRPLKFGYAVKDGEPLPGEKMDLTELFIRFLKKVMPEEVKLTQKDIDALQRALYIEYVEPFLPEKERDPLVWQAKQSAKAKGKELTPEQIKKLKRTQDYLKKYGTPEQQELEARYDEEDEDYELYSP